MKRKIIVVVLILVLIILLFVTVRTINNAKIFKQIENSIVNFRDSGNFLYQVTSSNERNNSTKQVYNNTKIKLEKGNAIYYGDMENGEVYAVNVENNTYNKLSISNFKQILPTTFLNPPALFSTLLAKENNIKNNYILMLLTTSISDDNYNGIECYKISILGTEKVWVSKDSLLPIKSQTVDEEYIYSFKSGVIKEEDVILKNLDEFKLENN